MKKFLFRVSSGVAQKNKEIGYGHLIRAINLADSLRPNKIFFALEDYSNSKRILLGNGYQNIKILRKDISLHQDIKQVKKIIIENDIDVLIIDKRRISHEFIKQMNKIVKTVVISDITNIDFPSNLVINGFIGFENQKMKNKFNKKCLVGPRYFIINKRFSEKLTQKQKIDILVSFGGYDASNLVETFLLGSEKFLDDLYVKIILGPGTSKSEILKDFQKRFSKLCIVQKTDDMFLEISKSKFGFCAGGFTTYEFASIKIPFAIISQVPHQLVTAKQWEKKGIGINLGMINSKTVQKITHLIRNLDCMKIKYKNKKRIIDGQGVIRVAKEIEKL